MSEPQALTTDDRTTHTPGPWTQYCHGNQVYGGDRFFITAVQSKRPEADARLIAAAPELLSALKNLLQYIDDHHWGTIPEGATADQARLAITKADGTDWSTYAGS